MAGLSLSFNLSVALIFTSVTNLLLYVRIVSTRARSPVTSIRNGGRVACLYVGLGYHIASI